MASEGQQEGLREGNRRNMSKLSIYMKERIIIHNKFRKKNRTGYYYNFNTKNGILLKYLEMSIKHCV